jgi:hypothetical protein
MSLSPPIASPVAAGPPVVGEAGAPASVRNGSASVKQAYAAARSFEAVLLQQLTSSLAAGSGMSGEGESEGSSEESSLGGSSGEASGGMLASTMPSTLAETLMRSGGLGIAAQLMGPHVPGASVPAGVTASGGSPAGILGPAGGLSAGPAASSAPAAAVGTVAPSGGVAA